MVSKASDDLPDPDRPVMTVSESRGRVTSMPLRLCSRAPETTMAFLGGTDIECSQGNRRSHRGRTKAADMQEERVVRAAAAPRRGLLLGGQRDRLERPERRLGPERAVRPELVQARVVEGVGRAVVDRRPRVPEHPGE